MRIFAALLLKQSWSSEGEHENTSLHQSNKMAKWKHINIFLSLINHTIISN